MLIAASSGRDGWSVAAVLLVEVVERLFTWLGLLVAVFAPPLVAALTPAAAKTVFAAKHE